MNLNWIFPQDPASPPPSGDQPAPSVGEGTSSLPPVILTSETVVSAAAELGAAVISTQADQDESPVPMDQFGGKVEEFVEQLEEETGREPENVRGLLWAFASVLAATDLTQYEETTDEK